MNQPPIVLIPTHSRDVSMAGLPPAYIMGQNYVKSLARAGATSLLLPLYADEVHLRRLYDLADGVFLAGGSDLNPSLYGSQPHAKLGELDRERDRVEVEVLQWALADGKPVLAVCRGHQVLNVAAGGSLFQDIATDIPNALEHNYWQQKPREYLAHEVAVEPDSRLRQLLDTSSVDVNSLHHQSIDRLGAGLRVVGRAPDGVVEAVESANGTFAVGVQWHPEALDETSDAMRRLFAGFVAEVEAYRRR